MTKKKLEDLKMGQYIDDKYVPDHVAKQLDFFFWLGAEGEVESVSEEEFNEKQEKWDGERPANRDD